MKKMKKMTKNSIIAEYQDIVGYLYENPTAVDVEYWILKLNVLTGQLADYILKNKNNG